MNVLLGYIHRSTEKKHAPGAFETLLPIGICSLYAQLRTQAVQATLVNFCGMSDLDIVSLLHQLKPTMVGLSQWTHNRHSTLELARLVKQTLPTCLIVLGGGHATSQAELLLECHSCVDLVAVGEAEETLLEIVAAISAGTDLTNVSGLVLRSKDRGVVRTTQRQPIADLDRLAFPSSWLHEAVNVDCHMQAEFFSSSRGCPAACRFCASPGFWGRHVRFRSVASVVKEMRQIRDRYGLIYFSMRDDTFTADRKRVVALCQELLQQGVHIFWSCQSRVEAIDPETLDWMRRAGCECIQLGVESGAPAMLKLLGKRTTPEKVIRAADQVRQAGMQLSVYLISGIPEETPAMFEQTIQLIKRIRPDDLQVAPLAYYPGTALFEDAITCGVLPENLFELSKNQAVLACNDGSQQVDRLLRSCRRYYHRQTSSRLLQMQNTTCFSAVTAMQLGDIYAAEGNLKAAEQQYREITSKLPEHPWGWYLLGELHEQAGRGREALNCYRRVIKLVPHHLPSAEGILRLK